MRFADQCTIKSGVLEGELIKRVGNALYSEIKNRFPCGKIIICVGLGNNGADGKALKDFLDFDENYCVSIFDPLNDRVENFNCDVIVDCLFGTGLNRDIQGEYKSCVELINASKAFVIACDIPSGINGDTGKVMGVAVKANLTIAVQEYKLGHFLCDAPSYVGELIKKDVGITVDEVNTVKRFEDCDAKRFFPKRERNVHKGCFGKTAIIGGSKNYTGSVILSLNALCSLKTGVGYSRLIVPESLFSSFVGKVPECILSTFNDSKTGVMLYSDEMDTILSHDSIAIGMGMGVSESVYQTIKFLLQNYKGNLLIDADGLNALAEYGVEILKEKKCKVILTPHVKEFSRLTKKDKAEILNNPIENAREFALKFDCIVLLKNAISVITDGEKVYLNTTGCPAMAKGGSGDVLSGISAGLLARKDSALDLITLSAYIFGKAGEIAEAEQNEYTATPSDVILALPRVINGL